MGRFATLFWVLGVIATLQVCVESVARATPINCYRFWSELSSQNLLCDEFTSSGFPATVGGSEIRIFHYSTGWNDELGQRQLLAAASDAARIAAEVFSRDFTLPKITFILHNEYSEAAWASAAWLPPTSTEPCRVDLFFNIPNSRDLAMQVAAHEIFHCVQARSIRYPMAEEFTEKKVASWAWWVEGTADYMSSKLFPAGAMELGHGAAYKPQLPLYRQPNPYSTVVFWDYLASTRQYQG